MNYTSENNAYAHQPIATGQGSLLSGAAKPHVETPIEAVHSVFIDVHHLSSLIQGLANELCGPHPETKEKAAPDGVVGCGLLQTLADHAYVTSKSVDEAKSALSRIRSMLP